MSPVCRIVPHSAIRSSLCSQGFWFLVKIEGGFGKNKLERSREVPKKTPVLKTRNAISGIRNIRNSLYQVCIESGMGCVVIPGIRYIRNLFCSGLRQKIQRGDFL